VQVVEEVLQEVALFVGVLEATWLPLEESLAPLQVLVLMLV
jgi:hypothetical protein